MDKIILKYILTAMIAAMLCTGIRAESFVRRSDGPSGSLDGKIIALWHSHGRYYDANTGRWDWQRPRMFGTVEDLYSQSYVIPFLLPMLENAGAYVMLPRERDLNTIEVIIDHDIASEHGHYSEHNSKEHWKEAPGAGFGFDGKVLRPGDNPFATGTSRYAATVNNEHKVSNARWTANLPKAGNYAVYISYSSLPQSVSNARYTVNSLLGATEFTVDQRKGGGTWIYLGTFPLAAGHTDHPVVELSNLSDQTGVVTADAVKIGGGMGNVERQDSCYDARVSRRPRWAEGSRYWLQWAGAPDSVYASSEDHRDYTDDFRSRGMWVNWLLGGSKRMPDEPGLGIPVDMAMGFHTDAGTRQGDETVGTLGIYCTERRSKFADGRRRTLSRALADSIVTTVVNDIRTKYNPDWTRRRMRDARYAEARIPQVPSMLLELLSHQNFADMKYGLDPRFRFNVSRSVYKGILKYFASTGSCRYVVQPLPPDSFAIHSSPLYGEFRLTWSARPDTLEPTAMPSKYMVEERIGRGPFKPIGTTTGTEMHLKVTDNNIHSYRVTAINDGGRSFPSEILALCTDGSKTPVMIVNGFTRVSGPHTFESGNLAGFDYGRDFGVPYVYDLAYSGEQTEFDRTDPYISNDHPGFGASRAYFDTDIASGNTSDYVVQHGESIRRAGHPFISSSAAAFTADTLTHHAIVDLILGKQKRVTLGLDSIGSDYAAFTPQLRKRLRKLAESGAGMIVSGAYVGSDAWRDRNSTYEEREFAEQTLGYRWRSSRASVDGKVHEVGSAIPEFGKGSMNFATRPNSTIYSVESPDAIMAADSCSSVILRYDENDYPAGVAYRSPTHRSITTGFPIETIAKEADRHRFIRQALIFITNKQD